MASFFDFSSLDILATAASQLTRAKTDAARIQNARKLQETQSLKNGALDTTDGAPATDQNGVEVNGSNSKDTTGLAKGVEKKAVSQNIRVVEVKRQQTGDHPYAIVYKVGSLKHGTADSDEKAKKQTVIKKINISKYTGSSGETNEKVIKIVSTQGSREAEGVGSGVSNLVVSKEDGKPEEQDSAGNTTKEITQKPLETQLKIRTTSQHDDNPKETDMESVSRETDSSTAVAMETGNSMEAESRCGEGDDDVGKTQESEVIQVLDDTTGEITYCGVREGVEKTSQSYIALRSILANSDSSVLKPQEKTPPEKENGKTKDDNLLITLDGQNEKTAEIVPQAKTEPNNVTGMNSSSGTVAKEPPVTTVEAPTAQHTETPLVVTVVKKKDREIVPIEGVESVEKIIGGAATPKGTIGGATTPKGTQIITINAPKGTTSPKSAPKILTHSVTMPPSVPTSQISFMKGANGQLVAVPKSVKLIMAGSQGAPSPIRQAGMPIKKPQPITKVLPPGHILTVNQKVVPQTLHMQQPGPVIVLKAPPGGVPTHQQRTLLQTTPAKQHTAGKTLLITNQHPQNTALSNNLDITTTTTTTTTKTLKLSLVEGKRPAGILGLKPLDGDPTECVIGAPGKAAVSLIRGQPEVMSSLHTSSSPSSSSSLSPNSSLLQHLSGNSNTAAATATHSASDEVPQIDTTGTAEEVATVTSEPQSDMCHAEEDPATTQPAEPAESDSQTAEGGDGEASSCEITLSIPGSEETQTEREGAKAVLGTERDSATAVLGTALQTERDRAKGMLGTSLQPERDMLVTALQDHSCEEPADPDIQSSDKTVTNTHELPKNVVVKKVESSSLPVEFDKTVSDGENVFINKTISMVIPHEDSEVGVKEDDRRPESESGLKTDSVVSQVAKDQEKKDIIDMTPDVNATTILVNSEKPHSVKECSNMVSPMERTCTDDKVEGLASMAKASLNKTEKNSEAVDSKRAASVHIKVGDPFISADIGKKTEVGSFLPLSLKHGSANETFVKLEPKPRAEEATLRSFSTQSFLTPLKSSSRASSMSPDSAVSSPTSDWSPTATTTTGGLLSNKSGSIKLTINQNRLGCLSSSPPDTLPSTSARTGHGVAKDMPDVDGNEVRALLMKKNSVKLTNSSDSRRASTDSSNAADESSDSVSRPMHRPHPLLDHDYTVFAYFNAQLNKTYADEVPVKSGHRHLDIKPKKRGRKKKSESGEGKEREKVKKRPYKRKHKANVSDTSRPATPGADSNDSTPPPLIPVDAEPEEKKEAKIVKEVPSRSPSKRKSDRNYVKITGSYQDEFVYFATRKIGRSRSRGSTDSHTPTTPVINPAFTDFSWYKELAKQKDKQEQFHGVQQGGLHISKSDSCLERRASVGTSASGVASEEDFSSVMGMTEEDNKMISSLLSWGQSPLKGATQKSIEPGVGLRKSLTMEGIHDQLGGQVQDLQALGLSLTQDQIKAVQNIIENDPGLMEQINQNFPGSESGGEGAEKKAVEEKDENSQSEKKLSSTCPGGDNITIPGGQRSDLPFKEDMDGFETSVPVVPLKSAVIGGIGEKLPNPNMTPETSAADLFELDMNDLIPSSVANMSMILCDLNTDTKSSLASISTPINTSGAFENPLKITPTLNTLLCDQSESPLKSFMPSSTLPEMPTMASVVDFEGETNSLDKTELFPDIQQTFISSNNGTNDVTAPELTTVSMYWNDLPGLLINNKEYVRLVDIHKQILPAKDTGILKKRCQTLGMDVTNCSDMQRDFLIRYANAAKSKSTVIVSREVARILIGYYVEPRPKVHRFEVKSDGRVSDHEAEAEAEKEAEEKTVAPPSDISEKNSKEVAKAVVKKKRILFKLKGQKLGSKDVVVEKTQALKRSSRVRKPKFSSADYLLHSEKKAKRSNSLEDGSHSESESVQESESSPEKNNPASSPDNKEGEDSEQENRLGTKKRPPRNNKKGQQKRGNQKGKRRGKRGKDRGHHLRASLLKKKKAIKDEIKKLKTKLSHQKKKDVLEKDVLEKDALEKDAPEKDAPEKDAPEKDAPEKSAAPKSKKQMLDTHLYNQKFNSEHCYSVCPEGFDAETKPEENVPEEELADSKQSDSIDSEVIDNVKVEEKSEDSEAMDVQDGESQEKETSESVEEKESEEVSETPASGPLVETVETKVKPDLNEDSQDTIILGEEGDVNDLSVGGSCEVEPVIQCEEEPKPCMVELMKSAPLSVVHRDSTHRDGRRGQSQEGDLHLHLYQTRKAPCVYCSTCGEFFSIRNFLRHLHDPRNSDILLRVMIPQKLEARNSQLSAIEEEQWEEFKKRRQVFESPETPTSSSLAEEKKSPIVRSLEYEIKQRNENSTETEEDIISGRTRHSTRVRKRKQLHPIEKYVYSKMLPTKSAPEVKKGFQPELEFMDTCVPELEERLLPAEIATRVKKMFVSVSPVKKRKLDLSETESTNHGSSTTSDVVTKYDLSVPSTSPRTRSKTVITKRNKEIGQNITALNID